MEVMFVDCHASLAGFCAWWEDLLGRINSHSDLGILYSYNYHFECFHCLVTKQLAHVKTSFRDFNTGAFNCISAHPRLYYSVLHAILKFNKLLKI